MRWSDFSWIRKVEYSSEESIFYNKHMLNGVLRTVNYYEKGFLNNMQTTKLGNKVYNGRTLIGMLNGDSFQKVFTSSMLRRIEAMADYIYDESAFSLRDENTKINHERNLKVTTAVLIFKLFIYYTQALTTITNAKHADKIAKKCFYEIIMYMNAGEEFDEIITLGNESYDKAMLKLDSNHKSDKYAWDDEREFILFTLLLNRNIENSFSYDFIKVMSEVYSHRIGKTAVQLESYKPESIAHDIIKKCIVDLNALSLDMEVKNRMMLKLNSLFEESIFDSEKEAELIRAALIYTNNRRPTMKCERLFSENKDKYNYKGVVYHGFRDIGYGANPRTLLQDYHDGFISCSKDLAIAAEFSGYGDYVDEYQTAGHKYNDGLYVLEILIDDNVEAIDIEQLLKDSYKKYPGKYENMFKSYIREKEVLLKLPMVSYNILSQEEIEKRLGKTRDNKWETYRRTENGLNVAAPEIIKPKPLPGSGIF